MGQIVITRKNGEKYTLAPKKEAASIKEAKQKWGLLGDDVVNITMESRIPQSYEIGDSINVFGRLYKLNQLPKVQKTGANRYSYELTFEGVQYDLLRAFYDVTIETTGNTLQDVQGDALTGNLRRFATVLIANANRVFPGMWRLGECPETAADKTLTFSDGDNCLAVFQSLCQTFEVEAEIVQKEGIFTINFAKSIGKKHAFVFEFGKGKGLYAINRQNVDSSNIVTRLKVYGSSDNITSRYRANRLCLPTKSKGQSFIEQKEAVTKYGVHEARKVFEEIKPTFNGRVSAIVEGSVVQFRDETMFDLNEKEADGKTTKYLVAGLSAKIHFNTGNLAGYEFEIQKYDHATKTFTLKKLTDDRGEVFPSEKSASFQFLVGDEYKILDVALPERYQDEAEKKLLEKGLEYYKQNSQPRVKYGLSISSRILEKIFGGDESVAIYSPGDYVNVKDEGIGVEKAVRIQSLQRNLLNIYDYDLTLSDVAENSITTRVISDLITIDKIATNNRLKDPARAKANWQTSREVLGMVYDTDGYFDASNIKPNSIETNMLAVGAKSQQFLLRNVVFEANFGGDCYKFRASDGDIVHLTINEEGERTWTISERIENLAEDKGYYVFAKCPKVGTMGMWHITTQQLKVENASDSDYYYFQVGIISSVRKGAFRDFVTTYGFTRINGNTITTGRVATTDGNNYLDLDGNQFRMGNNQSYIDWNVTKDGQLTLHNVRLLSSSGDTAAIGVFRGEYNPSYTYYKGDEVTFATPDGTLVTYRYINNAPSKGTSPLVASHWQAVARGLPGAPGQPGEKGKQGIPGEKGQDGRTTYFHIKYSSMERPNYSWQMSESPNTFIGTYVDFEETDSDDPSRYTWYRFQGLQGADGERGIPGRNGSDGRTSYLHIKYSNDNGRSFTLNNGETVGDYIGQCTDFNEIDPSSPSAYKWSKTKGDKGDRGERGRSGADGLTPMPNLLRNADLNPKVVSTDAKKNEGFAWRAETANGGIVRHEPNVMPPHAGAKVVSCESFQKSTRYNDVNCIASLYQVLDLTAGVTYTFSVYVKGAGAGWMIAWPIDGTHFKISGASPIDEGKNTAEGWKRYAVTFTARSTGSTNIYLRSWCNGRNGGNGGKVYFACPKLEESYRPTPWMRAQEDFRTDYTELRFAVNGSRTTPPEIKIKERFPKGWKAEQPAVGDLQYLWMTSARISGATGALLADWSKPTRISAADGAKGDSPVLAFRGTYDSSKTYYGTSHRVDAVKIGNEYYVARTDAGEFRNVAPPDASKWNNFGANFESVATNLLLAEKANIGDWFLSGGKIVSTLDERANKIELDAKGAEIKVTAKGVSSENEVGRPDGTREATIDASRAIVEVRNPATNDVAQISSKGIFANNAETRTHAPSVGSSHLQGAIVAVARNNDVNYDVNPYNGQRLPFYQGQYGVIGVYGRAHNVGGNVPTYGGYFENLHARGLSISTKHIDRNASDEISETDTFVFCSSAVNGSNEVKMPEATRHGQTIIVRTGAYYGEVKLTAAQGQAFFWPARAGNRADSTCLVSSNRMVLFTAMFFRYQIGTQTYDKGLWMITEIAIK